jgi:hypothetical protein
MATRIRIDPTGTLARLRCDECRRVSTIFLVGATRGFRDPERIRDWLRWASRGDGWGQARPLFRHLPG